MLNPDERRLVETFRRAKTVRIIVNEGQEEDKLEIFFPIKGEATKQLCSNLRWTMQDYFNAVKREASLRSENQL